MAYSRGEIYNIIREDLEKMEGHLEPVRVGFFAKKRILTVPVSELHVNPGDEFASPEIGPNEAIVANYTQIALRNPELGLDVFPEPIIVNKLKEGGYLILNGHHRWAGAVRAHQKKVRISISNEGI